MREHLLTLIIVFAVVLVSCRASWDHYPKQREIADGYWLTTSSPEITVLTKGTEKEGKIVIGPDVQDVAVEDGFIIGRVVERKDEGPILTTPKDDVGWFRLQIATGELEKGLDARP